MQNFKEDKPQPVRDEYEYVSDDGELKIDEFPIRRKKNAPKRDLSFLLDKKEPLPTPVTKPKLDSALYKVNAFWDSEALACMLLGGMPLTELSAWGAKQGMVSGFL